MQVNFYLSVSQFTDEGRNNESGNSGESVGDGHQRAGVVGCDVDVIGQESAVHSGEEHGAERHKSHGNGTVTSSQGHAHKTSGRKESSCFKVSFVNAFIELMNRSRDRVKSRTDSGGNFAHDGGGGSFALGKVQQVTPQNTEDEHGQVWNGRQQSVLHSQRDQSNISYYFFKGQICVSDLADVETQDLFHVSGQFDEQHVPTEVVAHVRHQDGPERCWQEDRLPRNGQVLQQTKTFNLIH